MRRSDWRMPTAPGAFELERGYRGFLRSMRVACITPLSSTLPRMMMKASLVTSSCFEGLPVGPFCGGVVGNFPCDVRRGGAAVNVDHRMVFVNSDDVPCHLVSLAAGFMVDWSAAAWRAPASVALGTAAVRERKVELQKLHSLLRGEKVSLDGRWIRNPRESSPATQIVKRNLLSLDHYSVSIGSAIDVVSGHALAYSVDRFGRAHSMRDLFRSWMQPLIVVVSACVTIPLAASAADDTQLTKEQIKVFLQTAKVIKEKPSSKGITHPWHLTLSDGTTTHDASFQSIDEHKSQMKMESGYTEFAFVDSYKYNIAAYQLAELLGVDDMMPVYVERKWQGMTGSISWWLPVKMDEADRVQKKIAAPDTDRWNKQMYHVRVFDELVNDTDANLTNVLIGED